MSENKVLDVYIEIPVGGGVRHERGQPDPIPYKGTSFNVPAFAFMAYGCLPEITNPADGDDVDVFVLGADKAKITSTIKAKLIGIRFRLNGDHKLLSVSVDNPVWNNVNDVSEIDQDILGILGRYVEKKERDGETWGNNKEAQIWLESLYGKAERI